MKTGTVLLGLGAAALIGYLLYRRYQDQQRAAAHPLTIPSNATLLRPLPVDPSLVTDAHIVM